MPVEINELIIKVTVNKEHGNTGTNDSGEADKEATVREAVEEMLRIADQKKER